MDIKPFFDLLGRQSKVARAFGVTDAAVLKWKRDGRIPAHREERGREILAAAAAVAPAAPETAVIASGAIPATVVE
jgi:predicted site-specific integrase-resolvase